ncbi:MAG: glycogen/starch/alpha-glucan phosphorylase [Mycoplasmatales bacterium]
MIKTKLLAILKEDYQVNLAKATDKQLYYSLLKLVKTETDDREHNCGKKKVYYISSEFLIGKLLSNNLINLGIYDDVKNVLKQTKYDLSTIEEVEPEPSLGNGGLGRLAACFVDSIATLGLNGSGIGILYHFGLFRQVFEKNSQVTYPNPWLENDSWITRTSKVYSVDFAGKSVIARLYQIDVLGYEQGLNKLNLFDLETVDETIVKKGINFEKKNIEKNLSLFLYPDDSDEDGELLRIFQQYFMVSAGAQLILDEVKAKGGDLRKLNEYAVIQINDTHPSLVIPELIRLLELEGLTRDEAILLVQQVTAYTNHTILAEALEKWPLAFLEKVVPNLVEIIKDLDKRIKSKNKSEKIAIIDKQKRVHMAHMDIHYGFSVNGVAALHTDILKTSELNHFYKLYPEKFNNKTNGITFRRWLMHTNNELTQLIKSKIGEDFLKNSLELEKLLKFKDDHVFLEQLEQIKQLKKEELAVVVKKNRGIKINPNSIYDIQIKRLHEYKRQQMNVLYIIHKYLEIKAGAKPARPITFFFGAKAAPAYTIAQDIIHLILCLSELINNDKQVSKYLKIVMVENYNVTLAEKLIPACDVSEQISLASKEASGTGNMKFMLNGAVTLGTMDGANVEIAELVGEENIFIFGKESAEVVKMYAKSSYVAKDFYEKPEIKCLVDFIVSKELVALGDKKKLARLHKELIVKDWFMTLLDLEDYIATKERIFVAYEDRTNWQKMCLVNIAKAGFFSSDRTIMDYERDIWKLK